MERLIPLLGGWIGIFIVIGLPAIALHRIIKRHQDRKQYEAETERMKAEAEMLKAKKEP